MTQSDLIELENAMMYFKFDQRWKSAILCSPSPEQIAIFEKWFNEIIILTIDDWNILREPEIFADVVFVSNVLMYISDPKTAINNLWNSANIRIIQDLINRNRGSNQYGDDGDCMRFSFRNDISKAETSFNLDYLEPIYYKSYDDNFENKHFIMIL